MKGLGNAFNSPLVIRIFRLSHTPTNCGVSIISHGSGSWKNVVIYRYLLYVHYLWSSSTRINEFLTFCSLCPGPDHFSAQKSDMWQ